MDKETQAIKLNSYTIYELADLCLKIWQEMKRRTHIKWEEIYSNTKEYQNKYYLRRTKQKRHWLPPLPMK